MEAFSAFLLLVAVVAVGVAAKQWLNGRLSPLKDHSKKQEEVQPAGVEIVVQKPAHERRLKLALPDLSSIQVRSPVGPMKSSIRSALKELRSRQMVQSICSKFESRMKMPNDEERVMSTKPLLEPPQPSQSTKTRRRDATVAPVLLSSAPTTDADVTSAARSNNLNKFLRSYASNLDRAISAERSVVMVAEPDEIDHVEGIALVQSVSVEATAPATEVDGAAPDNDMELELELPPLQPQSEYSNQCDTAEDDTNVSLLVEATDCDLVGDDSNDPEENNDADALIPILSKAFTPLDFDSKLCAVAKPETCAVPASKSALERFQQQVPANNRRLHLSI